MYPYPYLYLYVKAYPYLYLYVKEYLYLKALKGSWSQIGSLWSIVDQRAWDTTTTLWAAHNNSIPHQNPYLLDAANQPVTAKKTSKQAPKLQDAQAEKLTSLQAKKLTSSQINKQFLQ